MFKLFVEGVMKYRLLFLIAFALYVQVFSLEAAKLYQCGNNTYQQMPCNEGVQQKTLNPDITKKGFQFNTPEVTPVLSPQSSHDQRDEKRRLGWIDNLKNKYNSANKFCRADKKAFKKRQQRVVDTCKQRRDTFCNNSAEKIANINYNKASRSSSRPGWSPNHELNGFSSSTNQYCQEAKRAKKQLKDTYNVIVQ
jgi:hypothetical protein